ncbi:hypothetical protein [Corynebacterium epidermidicanis]|nr:hypothetical protein [Corynebacterium epidermidicanis]
MPYSLTEDPARDVPGHAISTALAIFVYLALECAVLVFPPEAIQSVLFNLGAMFAFFTMSLGYLNLFKLQTPVAARTHFLLNTIGILWHLAKIPKLLLVDADVHAYWQGLYTAESCMAVALIPLAWCIWHSPIVPRILALGFMAFSASWLLLVLVWQFSPQTTYLDWPINLFGGLVQGALAVYLVRWSMRQQPRPTGLT